MAALGTKPVLFVWLGHNTRVVPGSPHDVVRQSEAQKPPVAPPTLSLALPSRVRLLPTKPPLPAHPLPPTPRETTAHPWHNHSPAPWRWVALRVLCGRTRARLDLPQVQQATNSSDPITGVALAGWGRGGEGEWHKAWGVAASPLESGFSAQGTVFGDHVWERGQSHKPARTTHLSSRLGEGGDGAAREAQPPISARVRTGKDGAGTQPLEF